MAPSPMVDNSRSGQKHFALFPALLQIEANQVSKHGVQGSRQETEGREVRVDAGTAAIRG